MPVTVGTDGESDTSDSIERQWNERSIAQEGSTLTEAAEGDERCEQEESKSDFHNPDFDPLYGGSVQIVRRW
jgi:hypothetical protein